MPPASIMVGDGGVFFLGRFALPVAVEEVFIAGERKVSGLAAQCWTAARPASACMKARQSSRRRSLMRFWSSSVRVIRSEPMAMMSVSVSEKARNTDPRRLLPLLMFSISIMADSLSRAAGAARLPLTRC
jgi:hypothetical protein